MFPNLIIDMLIRRKKIVIISNQKTINGTKGIDQKKKEMLLGRIKDFIDYIELPIYAVVATSSDKYRKPNVGIWKEVLPQINGGVVSNSKDLSGILLRYSDARNWQTPILKIFMYFSPFDLILLYVLLHSFICFMLDR